MGWWKSGGAVQPVTDETGDVHWDGLGGSAEREAGSLPMVAYPFWFWKPYWWWFPSRSADGTWQTWAWASSPRDRVSIPCRSSARTAPRWCWSRSIRPGTRAAAQPGISQTTTAHWPRARRGAGPVGPGLRPPSPELRPRLASLVFAESTWPSPASLCLCGWLGGSGQRGLTTDVLWKPWSCHRWSAGLGIDRLEHDHGFFSPPPSSAQLRWPPERAIPCSIDVWGSSEGEHGPGAERAGSARIPPSTRSPARI